MSPIRIYAAAIGDKMSGDTSPYLGTMSQQFCRRVWVWKAAGEHASQG